MRLWNIILYTTALVLIFACAISFAGDPQPIGAAIYVQFPTLDPSTGVLADADNGTVTYAVRSNGNSGSIASGSATNIGTGMWVASFTPGSGSVSTNDEIAVWATGTFGGTAYSSVVARYTMITGAQLATMDATGSLNVDTGGVVRAGDALGRPLATAMDQDAMAVPVVYRGSALTRFWEACATRRADIALIGDSNVIHSTNSGHSQGMQQAFAERFGMYATETRPGAADMANGYYVNGFVNSSFQDAVPASHSDYVLTVADGFLNGPGSHASGTFSSTNAAEMYLLVKDKFLNLDNALRWNFSYATFDAGSGIFYPSVRRQSTLDFEAQNETGISTNTGAVGIAVGSLAVSANAARDHNLNFCYWSFGGNNPVGPVAIFWQRVQEVDVETGIGYNTLLYNGGQPTRVSATSLQDASQNAMEAWFEIAVGLQNADPMLLVHVVHGQNDDDDGANPSVGPNPADGDTPEGVADNHEAIIIRMRTFWEDAGYDLDNLFFLIGPYHPQTTHPYGQKYAKLRELADRYPNVAVMDTTRGLGSPAYFTAKSLYFDDGPGSDYHLTATGYDTWGRIAVNALVPTPTLLIDSFPGEDPYVLLRPHGSSYIVDTTNGALVTYEAGDYANYTVEAGAEIGSGTYPLTWPTNVAAGKYDLLVRLNNTPAAADQTVSVIRGVEWDGIRLRTLAGEDQNTNRIDTKLGTPAGASLSADLAAVKSDTDDTYTILAGASDEVGDVRFYVDVRPADESLIATEASLLTAAGNIGTTGENVGTILAHVQRGIPAATFGSQGGLLMLGANTATMSLSGAATLSGGLAGNIAGSMSGAVGGVTGLTNDTIADAVLAETVDTGVTVAELFKGLLAQTNGKAAVTDNGDGTETWSFYARDGTTSAFTVTRNKSTSARAAAGAGP